MIERRNDNTCYTACGSSVFTASRLDA